MVQKKSREVILKTASTPKRNETRKTPMANRGKLRSEDREAKLRIKTPRHQKTKRETVLKGTGTEKIQVNMRQLMMKPMAKNFF